MASLVAAARELEAEGVRAIVTCCGFFSVVQDALAHSVRVPVFTSPLMLVPLLSRMFGGREIGIVTASKRLLVDGYLSAAGIGPAHRIAIAGLEDSTEFYATHMGGTRIEMDVAKLRDEVVAIAVANVAIGTLAYFWNQRALNTEIETLRVRAIPPPAPMPARQRVANSDAN